MPSTYSGQNEVSQTGEGSLVFVSGANKEQSPHTHKIATHEHKKPQKWRELGIQDRYMILLTLGIMLIAGVTGYVISRQFGTMAEQTDILGIQAQSQAASSSFSAVQTQDQLKIAQKSMKDSETSFQQTLSELQKQSVAMQKSAIAQQRSSETIAHQLELSERPWIDANISLSGPLTFDINGANVKLNVVLRNTGHSPALNTEMGFLILIGLKGTRAPDYAQEACQQTVYQHGVALFPNAPFTMREEVVLGNEDIQEGKASKMYPGSKFGEEIIWPAVVVCIAYHPVFDEKKVYYTTYTLDLIGKDDLGTTRVNFKIGEDVPLKNMFLQLHAARAIEAK